MPEQDNNPQTEEKSEPELLQEELSKMTEHAKRTMADFQNFKRRSEEQRTEIFKMANESLVKSLLPCLDNFDRAAEHLPEEAKEWFKGLEIAIQQFNKSLTDTGLQEINPQPGEDFDPELHQALMEAEGKKDTVIQLLEKGYKLGNKVLRHAKVQVGNGN